MRDQQGHSRGFAFVSYKDRSMVDHFMKNRPHLLDGRKIESKRAMPRDEASKPEGRLTVKKIFIGAIKEDITEDDLKYKIFFLYLFACPMHSPKKFRSISGINPGYWHY